MQPVVDPYRALGVPRGASEADIKAAHRRLAKRFHPDASGGDATRFLKVQEAYRVLSNPLLRREWDARNAGPVRADRPVAPRPKRAPRPRRSSSRDDERGSDARGARQAPGAGDSSGPTDTRTDDPTPHRTGGDEPRTTRPGEPRSSRAYTWKASEVPWWEEGAARQSRRRKAPPADEPAQPGEPLDDHRPEASEAFEVYNRSSGAAWSMAARAYFRRGEQELPRRGSFRHEGTQPLTAARARAAAEAEARRRAAAPRPSVSRSAPAPGAAAAPSPAPGRGAYAYASAGVARDPERVAHVREDYLRRIRARGWPTIRQRMLYALLAWLPVALATGFGASTTDVCGLALADCPPSLEIGLLGFVGLVLLLLVVMPKVAYAAAMGTIAMLVAAGLAVGALAFMRAPLPPATASLIVIGAAMALAYVVTALTVAVRGGPWREAPST